MIILIYNKVIKKKPGRNSGLKSLKLLKNHRGRKTAATKAFWLPEKLSLAKRIREEIFETCWSAKILFILVLPFESSCGVDFPWKKEKSQKEFSISTSKAKGLQQVMMSVGYHRSSVERRSS